MILVVGDSMLDRYWQGTVDRISPEAPVPVLQVTSETARAGGAANVAMNLAALGNRVRLITPIGNDGPGDDLRSLLWTEHVDAARVDVVQTPCDRTTEKIRCVAMRQQIVRVDFEHAKGVGDAVLDAVIGHLEPGILVLSDYAKGALEHAPEMIAAARRTGMRVLVDPKGDDFERYRGAWLLKPNESEAAAVVGQWTDEADFRARCTNLRDALNVEYLLVTRGEKGMTLFSGSDVPAYLMAERREVYDVSGAGDTVLATLAHALDQGDTIVDAVKLANRAAGIVVGRFGTSTVTAADLEGACA